MAYNLLKYILFQLHTGLCENKWADRITAADDEAHKIVFSHCLDKFQDCSLIYPMDDHLRYRRECKNQPGPQPASPREIPVFARRRDQFFDYRIPDGIDAVAAIYQNGRQTMGTGGNHGMWRNRQRIA
jgi:hypothetical protein